MGTHASLMQLPPYICADLSTRASLRSSAARRPAIVLQALPHPMTEHRPWTLNGLPFRIYAIGDRWFIKAPTMLCELVQQGTRLAQVRLMLG
ncbi:hypothetical protein PALO_01100 [Cutibacterium avidum 44067]|nr:hypothetical protein PALO_01100 [Cutibacterium avidum 44067]